MSISHKWKAVFLFIMMFVFIYANLTSGSDIQKVCTIVGAWFAGFGCYYSGGVHLGIAEE